MKKILMIILAFTLFSCKKNAHENSGKIDSVKIIDSINQIRKKHNDSILMKNQFGDFSGNHKISFSTDGASLSGTTKLEKISGDEYEVSGSAKSGKNYVNIDGKFVRVSEKYLNFYGKITQKINGNSYERTKNTTFADEDGNGKMFRMQNKINDDGFVVYLDIYK